VPIGEGYPGKERKNKVNDIQAELEGKMGMNSFQFIRLREIFLPFTSWWK